MIGKPKKWSSIFSRLVINKYAGEELETLKQKILSEAEQIYDKWKSLPEHIISPEMDPNKISNTIADEMLADHIGKESLKAFEDLLPSLKIELSREIVPFAEEDIISARKKDMEHRRKINVNPGEPLNPHPKLDFEVSKVKDLPSEEWANMIKTRTERLRAIESLPEADPQEIIKLKKEIDVLISKANIANKMYSQSSRNRSDPYDEGSWRSEAIEEGVDPEYLAQKKEEEGGGGEFDTEDLSKEEIEEREKEENKKVEKTEQDKPPLPGGFEEGAEESIKEKEGLEEPKDISGIKEKYVTLAKELRALRSNRIPSPEQQAKMQELRDQMANMLQEIVANSNTGIIKIAAEEPVFSDGELRATEVFYDLFWDEGEKPGKPNKAENRILPTKTQKDDSSREAFRDKILFVAAKVAARGGFDIDAIRDSYEIKQIVDAEVERLAKIDPEAKMFIEHADKQREQALAKGEQADTLSDVNAYMEQYKNRLTSLLSDWALTILKNNAESIKSDTGKDPEEEFKNPMHSIDKKELLDLVQNKTKMANKALKQWEDNNPQEVKDLIMRAQKQAEEKFASDSFRTNEEENEFGRSQEENKDFIVGLVKQVMDTPISTGKKQNMTMDGIYDQIAHLHLEEKGAVAFYQELQNYIHGGLLQMWEKAYNTAAEAFGRVKEEHSSEPTKSTLPASEWDKAPQVGTLPMTLPQAHK